VTVRITGRRSSGPSLLEKCSLTRIMNAYLFHSLEEVRVITYHWIIDYNEARPHDALGNVPPEEYRATTAQTSTFRVST